MKILVPRWHCYHLDEVIHVLKKAGHAVLSWETSPRNYHYDPVFRRKFASTVAEREIACVFSLQYYPILSNLCESLHLPYISWCCNTSADQMLLTKSICNPCNIIFHGDSHWVAKLQRIGAKKVAYLPWAAGTPISFRTASSGTDKTASLAQTRINADSGTEIDISLIDTADREAWDRYLVLMARIHRRAKGFLDGLMQAQQAIYGFPFLEYALNDAVLDAMEAVLPLPGPRDSIAPREGLYARQILYPAITRREVDAALELLSRTSEGTKIRRIGCAEELPPAKIYLLPAPRDIQNGIPAQAMEIMGSGGFLLTSFQSDYLRFFEPGKDYVYYESPEDMADKARYYLAHQEERQEIARHGQRTVMAGHTLAMRVQEMLSILDI